MTHLKDSLNDFVNLCHSNALKAGWWTDLDTMEKEKITQNLVLAKLCLCHGEISEAMEGYRKGLKDDHLPHRDMIEVELADTFIRLADLAGLLELDLGGAVIEKIEYNKTRPDHKIENRKKEGGKKA
jgi:NTP pyrophosphatase (non-canonical NTP hydrolase)